MLPLVPALVSAPALGDDEASPFRITTDAGAFEVVRWAPPPAAVLPPADRTCRLELAWSPGGLEVRAASCPPAVVDEARATLTAWEITGPDEGTHDLGEIWFVYPHEVGPDVTVLVRQSARQSLALPPGVDAAPFAIRAWSFLRYPEEMLASDARGTCTVSVHADAAGHATEVLATGCATAFQDAATAAVRQWRFEPPVVHGEPIETSLTLTTTFDPETALRPVEEVPDEQRQELWASRQFDELTRGERLFFIRATLLGSDETDLGPGRVLVRLPAAADLSGRDETLYFDLGATGSSPPDLPDHDPYVVIRRAGRSEIEVFEAPLPSVPPLEAPARCRLLIQVDGDRHVVSWPQTCDEPVRVAALAAADDWILRHTGEARLRERFEVVFEFDTDGSSRLFLHADDVQTAPAQLPDWVHLRRPARPIHRVPPRLPRSVVEQGLPEGECRLAVRVSKRGSPTSVTPLRCPEPVTRAAIRAVKRWRWTPALEDGEAVPEESEVSIRFSG